MGYDTGPQNQNNGISVAIFLGSDISSSLLINDLIPALIRFGYSPRLYLPNHRSGQRAILPELRELAFFERVLPATVLYPYLEQSPWTVGVMSRSPRQVGVAYGIPVTEVTDINSAAFLAELTRAGVQAGISVRCYQKFGPELIQYFTRGPQTILWNLHPGILPEYRGVMTLFRSMIEEQPQMSYSLHMIDEQWDAGPIIDVRPVPLDLCKAMLTSYCDLACIGTPIVIDNLNSWRKGLMRDPAPQDRARARYHSFPTKSEMDMFLNRGFRLVDPDYMRSLYLHRFSTPNTSHFDELSSAINDAIAIFTQQQE